MEVTPHFEDIRKVLKRDLKRAKFSIYAAIGWLTDPSLIKDLTTKAKEGLNVEIVVDKNENNCKTDYSKFLTAGGKIYFRDKGRYGGYMHHKFCIIDLKSVILGSYNWSDNAATRNDENIVIVTDKRELIDDFANIFMKLKSSSRYILSYEESKKFEDTYKKILSEHIKDNRNFQEKKPTNQIYTIKSTTLHL